MSDDGDQNDPLAEAKELILALLLEEQLEAAQARRLEELVRGDPAVRQLYVTMMHQRSVIAAMAWPESAPVNLDAEAVASEQKLDETLVVRAVTADPMSEPALTPPNFRKEAEERRARELAQRRFRWMAVAASVAVVIGLGLFALVLSEMRTTQPPRVASRGPVMVAPPPATQPIAPTPAAPVWVAMLGRQRNAQWAGGQNHAVGEGLVSGSALSLASGVAEIHFASGTASVVEGPADFVVESNSVRLGSGKLSASVPPSGHGFTVHTPQSTVTDYGTELGVDVRGDVTEVDVFKGKVSAASVTGSNAPVMLSGGRAATVTAQAVSLNSQGAQPQRFVRDLSSDVGSLDVVDLVCGGLGTHRRGMGIDPTNGNYGPMAPAVTVSGDGKYHRLDLPVIDGCFIPSQRMVVDSAGDSFDFGAASRHTFGGIDAGNPVPWPPNPSQPQFQSVLSGVDYATTGHGFLLVHASSGLTLNLAELRRLLPGESPSDFTAVVGNTATRRRRNATVPKTVALVLVDGQVRYQREFTPSDGAARIQVPLSGSDHFLTLASVERKINTEYDWVIFGDPAIGLRARQ